MTDFAEGSEDGHELAPPNYSAILNSSTSPAFDPVQRPAHYASGGIECADAIEAALAGETDPVVAWARGNAIKYLWRTGKKDDPVQDLRKAVWYTERAAARIERREGRDDA